ncbi:conserved hypothetical protein [Verticillium alfalfae VaMs.102]|uniref:Uncharacterized protein n=1 Tax=Verticillium alfalfae (strain VaMs.102 / ATCC MYA-4576 / FGSC 10136) TaxID=526221 RepID=C9S5K8_VERA1|nr:conserved hypothetical protein [Verticillium alfalfae VaMs.102]EEY15072.1 conserved hypothetical protein [Verticillium alfalfae VaMs.102]
MSATLTSSITHEPDSMAIYHAILRTVRYDLRQTGHITDSRASTGHLASLSAMLPLVEEVDEADLADVCLPAPCLRETVLPDESIVDLVNSCSQNATNKDLQILAEDAITYSSRVIKDLELPLLPSNHDQDFKDFLKKYSPGSRPNPIHTSILPHEPVDEHKDESMTFPRKAYATLAHLEEQLMTENIEPDVCDTTCISEALENYDGGGLSLSIIMSELAILQVRMPFLSSSGTDCYEKGSNRVATPLLLPPEGGEGLQPPILEQPDPDNFVPTARNTLHSHIEHTKGARNTFIHPAIGHNPQAQVYPKGLASQSHHTTGQVQQQLEQDKPRNPDSLIRLPVPKLDFSIPNPSRASTGCSTSMFESVRHDWKTFPDAWPQDLERERQLRWTPFSLKDAEINVFESISDYEDTLVTLSRSSPEPSKEYATYDAGSLKIYQHAKNAVINANLSSREESPAVQPVRQATPLNLPAPPADNLLELARKRKADRLRYEKVVPQNKRLRESHQPHGKYKDILLAENEPGALSKMLSNYLALIDHPQQRAKGPDILRVSGNTFTAGVEMLDRDFSMPCQRISSLASASSEDEVSALSYEADLSISASTGIVVTTLLQVRQRPLPGSADSRSQLRKRINNVAPLYERLVVLVWKDGKDDASAGAPLSPAEAAAYSEFVKQNAMLRGTKIEPVYVGGGPRHLVARTIAKVRQYVTCDKQHLLREEETDWEVFFRQAGMNIYAAQVLAASLRDDFGDQGLERFLEMPREERTEHFQELLGGGAVLGRMCARLDKRQASKHGDEAEWRS